MSHIQEGKVIVDTVLKTGVPDMKTVIQTHTWNSELNLNTRMGQ